MREDLRAVRPCRGLRLTVITGARAEDLPQLYADIRAFYMQPGAHRTGEALIRAAGDAAEAGSDLRARREILDGIAAIAKSDPLQLAVDEFGLRGAVLAGAPAGIVGRQGRAVASTPKPQFLNPSEVHYSQTMAGDGGRVEELRPSMARQGWNRPPIDAVCTLEGIVTIDNTRVALAQEFGINRTTIQVWISSNPLPQVMISERLFGSN